MAFPHFQRAFVDTAGNVRPGLSVTVRDESTGAKAALFADKNGNTQLNNPLTTDSNGEVSFYAAMSEYRLTATGVDYRDIALLTAETVNQAVTDAQAAAQAAAMDASIYDDTTAGLAATVDGDYFFVPAAGAEDFIELYRNDTGSATLIDTYPNKTAVDNQNLKIEKQIRFFDSVSDMDAATDLSIGKVVRTSGYYTPGDGGGNDYEIVAAGTGTDDGGSFIDLSGSGLQAKGLFPYGGSLEQFGGGDGKDSTSSLKNAIAFVSPGDEILCHGAPIIRESITINKTLKIKFPSSDLSNRFVFDTSLPRTVQTFATHPDDGSDAPVSAAFVFDAAAIEFENVIVDLFVDYGDTSATNYGTDIDIGILNLTRERMRLKSTRTRGYWRVAGLYADCTQDNQALDRAWLEDCRFQGFWSILIQGPKLKTGETEILSGDDRGRGGASDWNSSRVWLEGFNHHSKVRASDTDGGCYYVDGKVQPTAEIDALQGRVWHNCRFDGADPFLMDIQNAIRDKFNKCFVDRKSGFLKTDGVTGVGTSDCKLRIGSGAKNVVFENTDVYVTTLDVDSAAKDVQFLNCRDRDLSLIGESSFLPALAFGTSVTYNSRSGRFIDTGNISYIEIDIDVSSHDNTDASQIQIAGIPSRFSGKLMNLRVSFKESGSLLNNPESAIVGEMDSGNLGLWDANGGAMAYTATDVSGILRIAGIVYL